ncbi:F-box/kelch-repeat protein [Acorus gramineus]|uniref:F-box/kelch-repeat protein n=1 Tax=Acorus gramineus TaxID=55184 RepID=A0AAV9A4Q5_ACOGR|nr:F-box/kelch-repeat protein [Acorus gramineus]
MESDLIPGLPEEIAIECLIRLTYKSHHLARRVSKSWRSLIDGPDLYLLRRQSSQTHTVACLVQALSSSNAEPTSAKPSRTTTAYGVTVFDSISNDWELLPPIPIYPHGLPLFCQVVGTEGKLIVLGGWDPISWDPVKDVWVYDFRLGSWRRGSDMPCARSFFAAGAVDGVVYVSGGHDASKNALRTASAYDVGKDVWVGLAEMGEGRDECEGVVVGKEFWVVGGYGTDAQGRFVGSAEVLGLGGGDGGWRRVEGVWAEGRCPRGCVGVGGDGERGVVSWADADAAVRVGTCAVRVGDCTVLTGSVSPGEGNGVVLVRGGKREAVEVPGEFSGFVLCGCSVEI